MGPRALFAIAACSVAGMLAVIVLRITVVELSEPVFLAVLVALAAGALAAYLAAVQRGGRIRVRGVVDEVPLAPVLARQVVEPTARPWPLETLAAAIAAAFDGSPYRVLNGTDRIRIMVDEQDPRYWRGISMAVPEVVQHWDLVARGDALTVVEGIDDVDWPVRPGSAEPVRAPIRRGEPRIPSGGALYRIEQLAVSFRASQARHERAEQPRWRFVTAEVRATIDPIAARAGWRVRRSGRRIRRMLSTPDPFAH